MATAIDTVSNIPTRITYGKNGAFYKEVNERVNAYFAGRARRDDPRFYKKALIVLCWIVVSYLLLLAVHIPVLQLFFAVSLGISVAVAGFNCFHDSIHGSASDSNSVNKAMAAATCSILGASRYFWAYKHNYLHHSYPNILHFDNDLETRGAMRLSPQQPWKKRFRYQHLWGWVAYSLSTIEWIFYKDFYQYFTLKMGDQNVRPLKSREKVEFWACKAIWFSLFVIVPLSIFSFGTALAGVFIVYSTTGLTLALIFQLAHISPNCDFIAPEESSGRMNNDYYYVQMATTTNFATHNPVVNWISGGLNFQVEHHLWPQITHTHYPDLAPIVEEVAHKHGLPYNNYKSYREALGAHYTILKELGLSPKRRVRHS